MRFRFLTGWIMWAFAEVVMATEEPNYQVVETAGAFELRAYPPMVVAETWVEGSLDQASRKGFKRLADYIFGNNRARNGASEKISMTAPVGMSAAGTSATSEKISMTAPVTMQQMPDQQWHMYFVMPAKYTLQTLPIPNQADVTLREVPARRVAVLRFSGLAGEEKTAEKTAELLTWLSHKNITPLGKAELARYNPPWTLPFLRRNEIMVNY